jgi:hypothetical protein
MASKYSVKTGSVACASAATKSFWLINPATDGFKIKRIGVSFDGSAAAQGIGVELYIVTTIGSPTGTSFTPSKYTDPNQAASSVTALVNLTAEPTAVTVLEDWMVTPFGGLLVVDNPLGEEPLAAAAGARWGMRYTTASGVTPNYRSYCLFEEQ